MNNRIKKVLEIASVVGMIVGALFAFGYAFISYVPPPQPPCVFSHLLLNATIPSDTINGFYRIESGVFPNGTKYVYNSLGAGNRDAEPLAGTYYNAQIVASGFNNRFDRIGWWDIRPVPPFKNFTFSPSDIYVIASGTSGCRR